MSNQARRFNFCKTVWGAIQRHLGDQIKIIGSRVSQEMVEVLRASCEQFGHEMGRQMSTSKSVQGGIASGVKNTAQDVESKLTENEDRRNKQVHVPTAMFTELSEITQVLTKNREEARNGLETIDQKLNGCKAEVLTSANTPIQTRSEQEWKDHESRDRHSKNKDALSFRGGSRN